MDCTSFSDVRKAYMMKTNCHIRIISALTFACLATCVLSLMTLPAGAKTLSEKDLDRGIVPKPGDAVILSDFSRVSPKSAVSSDRTKGKWWLRTYTNKDDNSSHTMLMTVDRDKVNPETCVAPKVTLPLNLKGYYEIWIGTYRGSYGGGIDVRLSNEKLFVHIDPQQIAHLPNQNPRVNCIVEMKFKPVAELKGNSLVFQQPHGTYESFHYGFCESSLAYVKLVRLSDKQVKAFRKDWADNSRRKVAYNDDGYSRFWWWGGNDEASITRWVETFRYQDVSFLGLCIGATTGLYVPSPYTDLLLWDEGRFGDKQAIASYKSYIDQGIDIIDVSTKQAHKYGIKLLPTLRMSEGGASGPHTQAMNKYRIAGSWPPGGALDYSYPEVRDYLVNIVRNVLETHDVDGFILDYTRLCVFFKRDEPNKVRYMNEFSAQMRKMVNEVSAKKHKKLMLVATFSNASYTEGWVGNIPPDEKLASQGIDVNDWVKNGYYDVIMPEGPNWAKYIALTKGTTTKCYPRLSHQQDIDGNMISWNTRDPGAADNLTDAPVNSNPGPTDYERNWLKLREAGADGVFIFNMPDGWTGLSRMGHIDEVKKRVLTGETYGVIEGPTIEFVK